LKRDTLASSGMQTGRLVLAAQTVKLGPPVPVASQNWGQS
jgi:hypothetical protein